MVKIPDLDIDIGNPNSVLEKLEFHVRASIHDKEAGELKPHGTGYYLQAIPTDRYSRLAAFPYDVAEDLGYIKFDLIRSRILSSISFDKYQHYRGVIISGEYDWGIMSDYEVVSKTYHISNHVELVMEKRPKSLNELAVLLAMIRPAGRRYDSMSLKEADRYIWNRQSDGSYGFKKSHAYGYAMMVMIHSMLIKEGYRTEEDDDFFA